MNNPTTLPPINLPPIHQNNDRPQLPPIGNGANSHSRNLPSPFPTSNKMGVQAILSESSFKPPPSFNNYSPYYSHNQPINYQQIPPQNHSHSHPPQISSPSPWDSNHSSIHSSDPSTFYPQSYRQNAQPPQLSHSQQVYPPHYDHPIQIDDNHTQRLPIEHSHPSHLPIEQNHPSQIHQNFTAPRSRPEFGTMDEVVARKQAQIPKSYNNENQIRPSSTSKRKREQQIENSNQDNVMKSKSTTREVFLPIEENDEDEQLPQQMKCNEDKMLIRDKALIDREKEELFVYKDLDVYDAQGSLKVSSDGVHDVLSKTPRFSIGRHVYDPNTLIDIRSNQVGGVFEIYVPGSYLGDNWAVRELLPQRANESEVALTPKVIHVKGKTNGLNLNDLNALDERKIWGTDVYTDDSDPVAIAVHLGWLFDASDRLYDNKFLVGAGRPAKGEQIDDIVDEADLILVFRVAPRLVTYHSSMRHRVWSRGWGNQHDGFSLVLEECRLVPKNKFNVIRPNKQLRKARIAMLAQARLSVLDAPSVRVKENEINYENIDNCDTWEMLSTDAHKVNKFKFNKKTAKMIRRGDKRFKRFRKNDENDVIKSDNSGNVENNEQNIVENQQRQENRQQIINVGNSIVEQDGQHNDQTSVEQNHKQNDQKSNELTPQSNDQRLEQNEQHHDQKVESKHHLQNDETTQQNEYQSQNTSQRNQQEPQKLDEQNQNQNKSSEKNQSLSESEKNQHRTQSISEQHHSTQQQFSAEDDKPQQDIIEKNEQSRQNHYENEDSSVIESNQESQKPQPITERDNSQQSQNVNTHAQQQSISNEVQSQLNNADTDNKQVNNNMELSTENNVQEEKKQNEDSSLTEIKMTYNQQLNPSSTKEITELTQIINESDQKSQPISVNKVNETYNTPNELIQNQEVKNSKKNETVNTSEGFQNMQVSQTDNDNSDPVSKQQSTEGEKELSNQENMKTEMESNNVKLKSSPSPQIENVDIQSNQNKEKQNVLQDNIHQTNNSSISSNKNDENRMDGEYFFIYVYSKSIRLLFIH